jgi:hypothetical protein
MVGTLRHLPVSSPQAVAADDNSIPSGLLLLDFILPEDIPEAVSSWKVAFSEFIIL